jgi:cellulose synthase/poly-beta-1,6-N-acetylglucosamine synthase-like glycosyltransferase
MLNEKASATLIISVYKDTQKLKCILYALQQQTCDQFDIIISEDGESEEMASFLASYEPKEKEIQHLTQPDLGFRKTRALNRAVIASKTDYLIFIDGDCVPHPRFIEGHIRHSRLQRICVGRRVEIGPRYSSRLIENPAMIGRLGSNSRLIFELPIMLMDGVKNPESGFCSPLLQAFRRKRHIPLLGCNFSCHRRDLERVNGFNEDYVSVGTGEDSDIDWRLASVGCENYDIKHLAPLFHLYHERIWPATSENGMILEASRELNLWRCASGLSEHTNNQS